MRSCVSSGSVVFVALRLAAASSRPLYHSHVGRNRPSPGSMSSMAPRPAMFDREGRYLPWQAEVRQSGVAHVKYYFEGDAPELGETVFWELRLVFGPLRDTQGSSTAMFHRWQKRSLMAVDEALAGFGLSLQCRRPSYKQASSWGWTGPGLGRCYTEAVGSTMYVVLALLHLSASAFRQGVREQSIEILADFLVFSLGRQLPSRGLVFGDHLEFEAQSEPFCQFAEHVSWACPHTANCATPDGIADLPQFLVQLFELQRKCHRVREWLVVALESIAELIAQRCKSHSIGRPSPEALDVMKGKKRAQRLDLRLAVCASEGVAEQRFRSASRMAVAGTIAIKPKSATSQQIRMAVSYLAAVHDMGSRNCQVSVSPDASREDTTIFAAWFPAEGKSCWLVPQACHTEPHNAAKAGTFPSHAGRVL